MASSFDEDDDFVTGVNRALGFESGKKKHKKHEQELGLLQGEEVMHTANKITFLSPIGRMHGTVYVTNYRLLFKAQDNPNAAKSFKGHFELNIPLGNICKIDKVGHSTMSRGEDSYGIDIVCRDFRPNLRFSSSRGPNETHTRRPLFEILHKYAFPVTNDTLLFAFMNREAYETNGWNVFDHAREFKRMGVPNETWKTTKINEKYEFSETYPSLLCVPAQALASGNDFLTKVGSFRSRNRIPVLSWLHPETQASITRSSQPNVGMTGRRSADDELYLKLIIDANANFDKLCIMDARPEVNAKVNKAKGGGYESEGYEHCDLNFLDIANIHVMRESLRKLRDVCYSKLDDKYWFSGLDESKWLDHIKILLCGARMITEAVEFRKKSVLVHCSDGWDRTAQLTCLSMLMLDGYYRTVLGFEVLIEKEWCTFGHKFAHRIGHGEDKPTEQERSPIFIQFLDGVWQLMNQFPQAFEFNSLLLLTIADQLYSCRFGTFLCNSEQQRVKEDVRNKSVSLWSHVNDSSNWRQYLNPLYSEMTSNDVIIPNTSIRRIRLWTDYYLQHNPYSNVAERLVEQRHFNEQLLLIPEKLKEEVERLKGMQSHTSQHSPSPVNPALLTSPLHKQQR